MHAIQNEEQNKHSYVAAGVQYSVWPAFTYEIPLPWIMRDWLR
jgi:uncharacterized protein YbdZ (MbtH family)